MTALAGLLAVLVTYATSQTEPSKLPPAPKPTPVAATAGQLVDNDAATTLTAEQVGTKSRMRYGKAAPQPKYAVTEQTIRYTSLDENNHPLDETARVFLPVGAKGQLTTLAFAPGTTGLGDACAASTEDYPKHNWGNYEAHLLTLAGQGYLVVSPDYEGMDDPARLHHYMVGVLEGRAVLDALRTLRHVPDVALSVNPNQQFIIGYSQGGQAAYFADAIRSSYAPDIKLAGVANYAPVSSVTQTLSDITHGSTLDWFGPYVIASYRDYYANIDATQILLPKWNTTLLADVTSHCIDTDPAFWGEDPTKVFTPGFISAMQTGNYTAFQGLAQDLAKNEVAITTSTPQLIVQGSADNVILPSQSQAMHDRLCQTSTSSVQLKIINGATHYSIPVEGLSTVTAWINGITRGHTPLSDCSRP